MVIDEEGLARLRSAQSGVVLRSQLRELGVLRHDVERMVRRKELVPIGRTAFVDHTGDLSWTQRACAATLVTRPSALFLGSATPVPDKEGPLHVAIDETRRVAPLPGVRLHRVVGLEGKVRWTASPPRLRAEHNAIELAHRAASETDAVRLLTDEINARRTTAARLRTALDTRPRMRRRAFVADVLADLATGACSVLERGYLERVARPHGFPDAVHQAVRRVRGRSEYRDVAYDGVVVELDGATGHASWLAGGRDADRDLDDLAAGQVAVRLRWRQVYDHPCRTAARLANVLQRHGWQGRPAACGPDCEVGACDVPGASQAPS